jgi:hypothetical protein
MLRNGLLAVAALAALALFGFARAAHADQLSCSSTNYRYQYCRADTRNAVRLVRQESKTSCVQGSSWGYDGRGIWVDNGCAATFEYGYGKHKDDTGKVVAGVAALAILGAIAASSNDRAERRRHEDDWGDRAPGFAIGSFSGNDSYAGTPVDITVSPSGRIDGWYDHQQLDGQFDGERAYLGGRGYSAYATRDGFQLVADDDRRMVINFWRN